MAKKNILSQEQTHLHGKDVANASGTLPEDNATILKMPHEKLNSASAVDPGAQGVGQKIRISVVHPYGEVIPDELVEIENHETD